MKRPICIAFLGTSLTADDNYGGTAKWASVAGIGLTGRSSREVIAYNFGVSGQDSRGRLAEITSGLYLPYRPEIIVMEFATNDAYTSRAMSLSESRANTLTIINKFKAQDSNVKAFLMTMNPCVPGSGPAADRPNLAQYFQQYRDIAAADHSIGLIDNYPDWGVPTYSQLPDGIHPIRASEQSIIAPNVVLAVAPYLASLDA